MNTIILNEQGVVLSIHEGELNPFMVSEALRPYIRLVDTVTNEVVGKIENNEGDYVDQVSAPRETPITTKVVKSVSVMDFKLRMSSPERVAIKELAKSDAIVSDFMEILDDQRLTEVDLNSDTIKQSLAYLMSKDVLTKERVEAIKS